MDGFKYQQPKKNILSLKKILNNVSGDYIENK
jgi:hypothetical protein